MWTLPFAIFATLSIRLQSEVVHGLQERVLHIADAASMGKVDATQKTVQVGANGAHRQLALVLTPVHELLHELLGCFGAEQAAVEAAHTGWLAVYPTQESDSNTDENETPANSTNGLADHT